jgi:hypothetical protein
LTSLVPAVNLRKNSGNRMTQPFAIIILLSLIIIIAGVLIGDDEKGLVMA